MKYQISLHQNSPKLYLIQWEDGQFLIGNTLFKRHQLSAGTHNDLDMERLVAEQRQLLTIEARDYLALAERSVLAFEKWLDKRGCLEPMKSELIAEMTASKFLSPTRYKESLLSQRWQQGGKPLWLIEHELKEKKVDDEIHKEDYDEVGALVNFIQQKEYRLKKDPKKFKEYLARKGFSFALIEKALRRYEESQNSD